MNVKAQLRLLAVAACCIASAACSSRRSGAEAVIRESLKDPDSAKFGNLYFNEKTQKGCLTVNAKNALGGYIGDQQAYVELHKGKWLSMGIANIDLSMCREVFADQAN